MCKKAKYEPNASKRAMDCKKMYKPQIFGQMASPFFASLPTKQISCCQSEGPSLTTVKIHNMWQLIVFTKIVNE